MPQDGEEGNVWVTRGSEVALVAYADPSGQPAIAHGSRVKIRLQHPAGWWVDRIPAWIKWATVAPGVMGAKYDGIYWDPPEEFVW